MKESNQYVNAMTNSLPPYPMEELARIRRELTEQGKTVYNFGTGDPQIPVWEPIKESLIKGISSISQYPTIRGIDALKNAHFDYLKRNYGISSWDNLDIIPTRGSKEAIFHIAQSLVGRANNRRKIIYPDPGYPVYQSSIYFAGGIPTPIKLVPQNDYLLEPWNLPTDTVKDAAGIWVNYPHNPTGASASKEYWKKLIDWCHKTDTILLADDCYTDIYCPKLDATGERPITPIALSTDRVLSFMSLSKRSGMTGYRAGFIAGDKNILALHVKARANFGLGLPKFIQTAAVKAWSDDTHVAKRREIFEKRLSFASKKLTEIGIQHKQPTATFYLWCKVPDSFAGDDIKFALAAASKGIILSPSSWLSENIKGYFRLALVPELEETQKAFDILEQLIKEET